MKPLFRLPGRLTESLSRRPLVAPARPPEARFTIRDVLATDEAEFPLELREARDRLDRHDDEVLAQRTIDRVLGGAL